jgi:hypothetical protein
MLTLEEADELGLNGESAECTSAGMAFFNIPISDRSVPNKRDEFSIPPKDLLLAALHMLFPLPGFAS